MAFTREKKQQKAVTRQRQPVKKATPQKPRRASSSATCSSAKSANSPKEYEVEEILKKRVKNNHTDYLVKWKDYDNRFNMWIPEENLAKCSFLLKQFKKESENPSSRKRSSPTPTASESSANKRSRSSGVDLLGLYKGVYADPNAAVQVDMDLTVDSPSYNPREADTQSVALPVDNQNDIHAEPGNVVAVYVSREKFIQKILDNKKRSSRPKSVTFCVQLHSTYYFPKVDYEEEFQCDDEDGECDDEEERQCYEDDEYYSEEERQYDEDALLEPPPEYVDSEEELDNGEDVDTEEDIGEVYCDAETDEVYFYEYEDYV